MGDIKSVRHLSFYKLMDFMLLDDDTESNNQLFAKKIEPFFGSKSSIKLENNTLYDIASTLLKEDVDFKMKSIVTGNEQERIYFVMGLIADYCCWTTFTQ